MTYEDWLSRWQLPQQAIDELQQIMDRTADKRSDHSEEAVASEARLEMGRRGIIAMRNNVGVLEDKYGRPVRYGLCNESKEMNKVIKSSDDILIIPYLVQPKDVGRKIGIFGAAEYKRRNWSYSGKGREVPQNQFHRMVRAAGGIGFFVNSGRCVIDTLVSHGVVSQ